MQEKRNSRANALKLHLSSINPLISSASGIDLPIFYWVTSLGVIQPHAHPNASEVSLADMGKIKHYLTTTKHNQAVIMCSSIWRAISTHFGSYLIVLTEYSIRKKNTT